MASTVMVIGVLIAILVFSAPLCYFAYVGMHEQRDVSMLVTETTGNDELDAAEERSV